MYSQVDEQEFGVGEGRGLAGKSSRPMSASMGIWWRMAQSTRRWLFSPGRMTLTSTPRRTGAHHLAVQTVRRQEVRAHDPHGMPRRRNLGADEIEDGILGRAGAVHEDAAPMNSLVFSRDAR